MRLVVVARNCAFRADDDEAAFGLRLHRPWIGESPPTRLELREAMGVAANGDRMLVDLEPLRLIDDRGHLDRRLAVHEPGPKSRAVAEIVEEAAAARGPSVPPRPRLLAAHVFVGHHDLVGAVIERP